MTEVLNSREREIKTIQDENRSILMLH